MWQREEHWRPVVGYEGLYEVSDLGRVRSLPRKTTKGGIMKPHAQPKYGHLLVSLSPPPANGSKFLVHRLVLEAFVGPCPVGFEARHFPDNDPANNRLENLSWGTRLQNVRDRVPCGTQPRGAQSHNAKLTELQVREMLAAKKCGAGFRALGRRYGVSHTTVRQIVSGERWAHLQ